MNKSLEKIKKTLKNWPLLVRKYQKSCKKNATQQILTSLLPFLCIIILAYFVYPYSKTSAILLGIINSLFLIRIFIIQHDCGHQSFFQSKKWNDFWGRICSFLSVMPYQNWLDSHNYHHAHNGDLDFREMGDMELLTVSEYKKKPTIDKYLYRFMRSKISILFLSPIIYLFVINRVGYFSFKNLKKRILGLSFYNLGLTFIFGALIYFFGWQKVTLIHLSILVPFAILAFWVFFVQHQHEHSYKEWKEKWEYLLAAIKGSTFLKLPKILQWFTGNIGFHHIHHLSPKIPNYNLEKCHTENPEFEKFVTIIGLKDMWKMLSNYLWDESQKRMITFREYKKLYGTKKSA